MTTLNEETPFILINTFKPVDHSIDELLAFQLAEMKAMSAEAEACGWLGNEVYQSEDGTSLVVVTRFRSTEAREKWAQTKRAKMHVEQLMPLVRDISSVPVAFVASHGASAFAQTGVAK